MNELKTKGHATGGRAALRGFSVQFLFALIRLTDPDEYWEFITIEHPTSESVDILIEYPEHKIAIQVKSTEQVFKINDIKYWAAKLEESINSDEYELALFGPVTTSVANAIKIGKVNIPVPQSLDLPALTERACRRLENLFKDEFSEILDTEVIVLALLQKLQSLAISGVRLSNSHFRALILAWIKGPNIETDELFSLPIREHFKILRKTVEKLTSEQYHVIMALRGYTRIRISGTAGSGKTLIAAERAIRLDHAGVKTLILCHSPNLATHLKSLTLHTEVDVYDFDSWINYLLEPELIDSTNKDSEQWTGYSEPENFKLSVAMLSLKQSDKRWDVIIIDEGQDIRYEWWPLIENALRDPISSHLTIFCDSNQKVTTSYDETYPNTDAVFEISKNCRNAAKIHDVVRRFYVYAPLSDPNLKGGEFQKTILTDQSKSFVTNAVKAAILQAMEYVEWNNLVIITGEDEPASESLLNNLLAWDIINSGWKASIVHYLGIIERYIREKGSLNSSVFDPPNQGYYYPRLTKLTFLKSSLTSNIQPTNNDVEYVQSFAKDLSKKIKLKDVQPNIQWILGHSCLRLRKYSNGKVEKPSLNELIYFLKSHYWAETIPKIQNLKVISTDKFLYLKEQEGICLMSPSSFKGLEADGVIFYLGNINNQIVQKTCVGLSRARFYLHALGSREQLARLPKLK